MENYKDKVIRKIIFLLLRASLLPWILRHSSQQDSVTVLLYHKTDRKTFSSHLEKLTTLYNPISLEQYRSYTKNPALYALPKRPLLITFDDGRRELVDLIDILEKNRVRPVVFVCSKIVDTNRHFWWTHLNNSDTVFCKGIADHERIEFLDKKGFNPDKEWENRESLTWEEIVSISPTFSIQSHSKTHPILPNCTDDKSREEISDSKIDIECRLHQEVFSFAYPNGDYTTREINYLREAGYDLGFTVGKGQNTVKTDQYRLSRFGISEKADINEVVVKASGLWEIMNYYTKYFR